MIDWPDPLVDEIARRRAVIVVGSGISKNSVNKEGKSPPTWSEFLHIALAQCPKDEKAIRAKLRHGDYLTACDWLKHRLDENWNNLLRAQFVEPAYAPAEIHKSIFQLDARFVVTPNFDKIYDNLCTTESDGTVIIKNYYDDDIADVLRGNKRAILKAHGTIDAPARMVFTREDYARVRTENAAFYEILEALLITNTFVFVGCGTDDPDFRFLLEKYQFSNRYKSPHYMTLANPLNADQIRTLRNTMNVKLLGYSANDQHKELKVSLTYLGELVDARREAIAEKRAW
ncbi:MAG: SIR2 family protein [Parvibaculum sp.]|uniref:SIR2 family NAD-dependent protein deacylase n=1 Tax=Parvibaculum sp. TaxID=2024848 RepID=UPI0025FA1FD7|nr:SIR2 family protein [Parvibaculum sp.]MCE9651101.1 SIR2 family protein [Parvibaculum sp.]